MTVIDPKTGFPLQPKPPAAPLVAPNGLSETYAFYGWDADKYLLPDMQPRFGWETMMGPAAFPAPLPVAGTPHTATSGRFHRKLIPFAEATFKAVHDAGLWPAMSPWAGAYNFRLKRNGKGLSMHALGAAFDIDPQRNPMREGIVTDLVGGLRGLSLVSAVREYATSHPLPFTIDLALVQLLVQLGWTWGGEFDDPQHFQMARGC